MGGIVTLNRIFIGSSTEALDIAKALKKYLSANRFRCRRLVGYFGFSPWWVYPRFFATPFTTMPRRDFYTRG